MVVEQHFGVYGAWTQDGRIVTVRKARGPYTGWLDLPGGRPDAGESLLAALQRELMEECGIRPAAVRSWHPFRFAVTKASDGRPIEFDHRGHVALLAPDGRVRRVRHVEDVAAVELLDLEHRSERVSPPLAFAIDLIKQSSGPATSSRAVGNSESEEDYGDPDAAGRSSRVDAGRPPTESG